MDDWKKNFQNGLLDYVDHPSEEGWKKLTSNINDRLLALFFLPDLFPEQENPEARSYLSLDDYLKIVKNFHTKGQTSGKTVKQSSKIRIFWGSHKNWQVSSENGQGRRCKGVKQRAKTFDDWRKVFESPDEGLQKFAISESPAYAETLDHWLYLFKVSVKVSDGELNKRACEELKQRANTFDDWHKISEISDEKLKILAYQGMLNLVATTDEWEKLSSIYDDKLEELMVQKLEKSEKTFDEWKELWNVLHGKPEDVAYQRMRESMMNHAIQAKTE